jgi:GNAT superfamily N-acetyltransferase
MNLQDEREKGSLVVGAANVSIGPDDAGGATARELIGALCAELSKRYESAPSPFSPSDASAPRTVFLVARLGGKPVGCGALRRIDDATAEIKRMYVAPPGRRRGIARRILAELECVATGFGYRVLRLETGIYQAEAMGLYESCGYRRIPAFGHYIGSAISVCYEKDLQ